MLTCLSNTWLKKEGHEVTLCASETSAKEHEVFCDLSLHFSLPFSPTHRHEVQAMAITDPVSGHAALLLLQADITQRAELEARMASLTESQLSMLEQMFPRWVLV